MTPRPLQLLAPARNAEIAIEAIRHGADAVYMGGPSHGARAQAVNELDDIRRVVEFAARYDARVYVTVNTIIYADEIAAVERLVAQLWAIGVDALIVQDMAFTSMRIPTIALHASTQCDIRSPERAAMLEQAGFSQLVLARELSLDEIARVRSVTTVPLEAFVHGALCVSYSGDCHASCLVTGRSANRGECAQVCRMEYDLIDGNGHTVLANKHLLSLRDMNRMASLAAMADAGISSFKIEGRLKDLAYVKTVVGAYRKALDAVIDGSEGRYCRASAGRVKLAFEPDVNAVFNRGFTDYFLRDIKPGAKQLGSHFTPKWVGVAVGKVKEIGRNSITIDTDIELHNGDGLTWFDRAERMQGFRVNRAERPIVFPAEMPTGLKVGSTVYRNRDKQLVDRLERPTAEREVEVDMVLRSLPDGRIALDVAAETPWRRVEASVATVEPVEMQTARTPQHGARRAQLARLGGTGRALRSFDDRLGDRFVPASLLASLRRDAVAAFDEAMALSRPAEQRRKPTLAVDTLLGQVIDYHGNVANGQAREFYESHGATVAQEALEIAAPAPGKKVRVMTTRYCLRRELGACLMEGGNERLRGPLKIKNQAVSFDLDFDCKACRMYVNYIKPHISK